MPTNGPASTNFFLTVIRHDFARLDRDGDGILSSNELDVALADPSVTNLTAAAVAALKTALRTETNGLPALTLSNICVLTAARKPNLALLYRTSYRRLLAVTNRVLFVEAQPRLDTIHQGRLGNCFCLAPLGALVHREPATVPGLFTAGTNGAYLVRLGTNTVTVTAPTDGEIALGSSSEHEGLWVNVYEKAVGVFRNNLRPPAQRFADPLDAVERGGSSGSVLALVTGHGVRRFTFTFAQATNATAATITNQLTRLRTALADAVRRRALMTCGTEKVTTPGLTPHHAYAVLDYRSATDEVELWNPHGQTFTPKAAPPGPATGYPTKKGVFRMPLTEWVKTFRGLAIEVLPG